MILGSHYQTALVMAKIWMISHLAEAALAISERIARGQRNYISIVLADAHYYPTSDGLETA